MITVSVITHTVFIIYRFSGLYAEKNVMCSPVLLIYIMDVICADERYTGFLAHSYESFVDKLLIGYAMVLELKKEITFTEYIQISECHFLSH